MFKNDRLSVEEKDSLSQKICKLLKLPRLHVGLETLDYSARIASFQQRFQNCRVAFQKSVEKLQQDNPAQFFLHRLNFMLFRNPGIFLSTVLIVALAGSLVCAALSMADIINLRHATTTFAAMMAVLVFVFLFGLVWRTTFADSSSIIQLTRLLYTADQSATLNLSGYTRLLFAFGCFLAINCSPLAILSGAPLQMTGIGCLLLQTILI